MELKKIKKKGGNPSEIICIPVPVAYTQPV